MPQASYSQHFSGHLLSMKGLQMDLFIGCEPEEKAHRQPIEIDLQITFASLPTACHSDELRDTVCYAQCCNIIRNNITNSSFHLIERLAYEIAQLLLPQLPEGLQIDVTVRKMRPPVPDVRQVSFTYSAKVEKCK